MKHLNSHRTVAWLILMISSLLLPAAAGAYVTEGADLPKRNLLFNQLRKNDGLSHEIVSDILQDRSGFIWLATQEGLNRFDGYQLEIFEHRRSDPTSLSSSFVTTLMIDRDGELWVGTENGVNRYDEQQGAFDREPFTEYGITDFSVESVLALQQTRDGAYWIGTASDGLFRVDPKSGHFEQFLPDSASPHALGDSAIVSLMEDSKGNLWVGTRRAGLYRFDSVMKHFLPQGSLDPADEHFLGLDIRSIFEDESGYVWVGTFNSGVSRFDPRRGSFERFLADEGNPRRIHSGRVRDIAQDERGTVWLATSKGLTEWRESEHAFVTYRHDITDDHTLAADQLNALYVDRSGVLWVGTWDGVSSWNYFSDTFTYLSESESLLEGNRVTAVAESMDGTLWVSTYGTGLTAADPVARTSRTYRHDPENETSLPDDLVMTVHVDANDDVWIGTRSHGLARLNVKTGRFERFVHDPEDAGSLSSNAVSSLYSEEGETLWIGTYGGGLNRLDLESGTFTHFRHDPDDGRSIGSDRITEVVAAGAGGVLIGTAAEGLSLFDASTSSFRNFRTFTVPLDPDALGDEPETLVLNTVTDVIADGRGGFWVASLGDGLLHIPDLSMATDAPIARVFGNEEGLPTSTIQGVLFGQGRELWISSNRGLIRLEPDTGFVRQFDSRNGLRDDEFNNNAALRSRTGNLYFGSAHGVVAFHPGELPVNKHMPSVVFQARSRERELATVVSGDTSPDVEVSYLDRHLAVDFVALDFISPDKHLYRYRLEGFDENWIEADQFRRAVYTNLPSGDYEFRIQAANNDGVWNRTGASMQVTVTQEPWKTWWAYLGYALLFLALIGAYLRAQAVKLRWESQQRVLLENEVSERTREIAQRNWELEKLNDKLAEASVTDSLTGLRNRRYVDQFINSEVSLFERSKMSDYLEGEAEQFFTKDDDVERKDLRTMFFMMIDLDGFKLINDRFGHHAGDMALIQVKDILEDCTRESDTLIRWGGDEFMVIGFASGFFGVKILAERIREAVAVHQFHVGNGEYGTLTASIGIAPYPLVEERERFCSWELVVAVADQGAYIAKASGRNAWVSLTGSENLDASMLEKLNQNMAEFIENGSITVDTSLDEGLVLPGQEPLERAS
ncbi:MAG: two-component regulator propeller domain-containing protein [Pseudomonadota bacterium]